MTFSASKATQRCTCGYRIRYAARRCCAALAPVVELHVRGTWRAAAVRLHTLGQPDARRPWRRTGRTRRRRRRRGHCIGHGGVDGTHAVAAPGDTIVAPHDCYGGTYRLFEQQSKKGLFDVEFVDQTDLEALRAVCANVKPKIILTESPSNPLLRIADLEAISAIAKDCGALFAVDNTFLSPALQNPIEFGADLVIHSTTKYINGHSDVVGGAIVAATDELAKQCAYWANVIGITGAPFDSFLTLRGVRT